MDKKELYKISADYQSLTGYPTAFQQRQAFALEYFWDVLNFAISLVNENEKISSQRPKHTIADNYPAGYREPECAIKGSCDFVNELQAELESVKTENKNLHEVIKGRME